MSLIRSAASYVYNEVLPMPLKSRRVLTFGRRVTFGIERFLRNGFKDMPLGVEVEINDKCNRSCSYCPRTQNTSTKIDEDTFKSIIDQLTDWGFAGNLSPHTYNEPLTDSRIFDFLKYAREKLGKSNIVLFTNGDLLDREKASRFTDMGIDKIRVSVHYPTSEKKFEELRELEGEYSIIEIVDFRDPENINFVNRGGLVDLGSAVLVKPEPCYSVEFMTIRADGSVVQCAQDTLKTNVFGNVKTDTLQDIWRASAGFRNEVRKGNYDLSLICQECGIEPDEKLSPYL